MRAELVDRVLGELRAGRRVTVVSPSRASAREELDLVSSRLVEGERVRRSAGDVRCESGAGRIAFTIPGALRGHTADVVVLTLGTPRTPDVEVMAMAGAEVIA